MNADEVEVQQLPKPTQTDPLVMTTGVRYARIEFPPKKGKPAYDKNPAITFW